MGVSAAPLQYSTQAAASSAEPVPALTVICGLAPISRQKWRNSALPKALYSSPPQARAGRTGRRSAGPTPSRQW